VDPAAMFGSVWKAWGLATIPSEPPEAQQGVLPHGHVFHP
jgi:hypothetical protein